MDSNNPSQVCPWCQTEIVWDPEIGPEDECPHCMNELKGYRTVKLKLKGIGEDLSLEEDEEEEDFMDSGTDSDEGLDAMDLLDDYDDDRTVEANPLAAKMLACMDGQEEAPDCSNCHELMLLAGVRKVSAPDVVPSVPKPLGKPFLPLPYELNVYVCPSCFKTDEYLSAKDRETMLQAFSEDED